MLGYGIWCASTRQPAKARAATLLGLAGRRDLRTRLELKFTAALTIITSVPCRISYHYQQANGRNWVCTCNQNELQSQQSRAQAGERRRRRRRHSLTIMIEVVLNDRLGKKIRVKCNEDDTVGDLKKLAAAQLGTRPEKLKIQKWCVFPTNPIVLLLWRLFK